MLKCLHASHHRVPQPPLQNLQPKAPSLVYLPSSVWCLDAGTQEKPPTDAVIDLWLSCYFCYCCCSQSGLLLFEVLHSVQQCSPLLKHGLTSYIFKWSPQEPEVRGWRWLHQKRTCRNSSPLLCLPLEQIWNSDFMSESNSLIKCWWIIYRILTYSGKTNVAIETLGAPWRSWLKENNKAHSRMSRLKLLL